jgi:hypothetical protein
MRADKVQMMNERGMVNRMEVASLDVEGERCGSAP